MFLLFMFLGIGVFFLFIRLLKGSLTTYIKFIAYSIDLFFIFIFVAKLAHVNISTKISTGNMAYLWDIVIGLFVCFLYYSLFTIFKRSFPKVGKVLNFLIVLFGVYVAYSVSINIITSLMKTVGIINKFYSLLPLLKNDTANKIVNTLIVFFIAIPVYRKRLEYLGYDEENILVEDTVYQNEE